jgi:ferritin-like metal-binding protein YciE
MAATLSNPQDLFLHELGEMLYVERKMADELLPMLSQEVQDTQLRRGIEAHQRQTQQHAKNLEKAFQVLGQEPQQQQTPALDGLKQSHDQLAPNIQVPQLRDLVDAEAAAKTEHLEIAAYKGLINMAERMGQEQVRKLLDTNCQQEERRLRELEASSEKLTRQIEMV